MLAFDLETTGIDARTARIVTASLIRMPAGGELTTLEWLADPLVEIPEEAAAVHGISTEHARENGRTPKEVIAEIIAEINLAAANDVPVVGFNVAYDISVLHAEAERHGVEPPQWFPVVDVMVLDKQLDKYRRGSRRLGNVAEHYGVKLENAHAADADALAAAQIFQIMRERFPELQVPLEELHATQVAWRREQQESLESYLRKKNNDPSIMVEKSWPNYLEELLARED